MLHRCLVATRIRRVRQTAEIVQDLYALSAPKATESDWSPVDEDYVPRGTTDYLISSASRVFGLSQEETYLFAASKDGRCDHWSELSGSERGIFDTDQAVRNAGYLPLSEEEAYEAWLEFYSAHGAFERRGAD